MAQKSPIQFHYQDTQFPFAHRLALKKFIVTLFRKEGFKVDAINYVFCTDSFLLEMNQQYLNHNTYTDIVTFPLSEAGAPIQSDIYISIDRVKENAKAFAVSFTDELHRVIFHGALHLCGYGDKTR